MNNYKRSTMLGYVRLSIHYVSNFLLVPIMLSALGNGEYGVYKIMTAISGYFIIADGGLSNTSIKFLSELRVKKKDNDKREFCGIALGYYLIVSLVLVVIGIILYFIIPKIYKDSLNAIEITIAQKMLFPLVGTYCLKLFTSLFRGYIKAYERYDISKCGEIGQDILRFGLIYIYITINGNAVGCVIIDFIVTLILLLYYIFYCIRRIDFSMKIRKNGRDKYKKIFSFSGAVLLETIAYQVFWTADSIILGIMTSTSIVAVYSVATSVNGYFQSISNVSNEFLMPEIIKMNTSNITVHFNKMVLYARVKLILLGLLVVGIVLLGRQFVFVWVGLEYEEAYVILLILMLPQLFIQIMDYPSNLMWILGKHSVKAKIMIWVAIANICLTIIGVNRSGMLGAAMATSISLLIGQGIVPSIYYWKVMNIDIWNFYKLSFSKIWSCIIGMIAIGKLLKIGNGVSWIGLIIQIILITVIYFAIIWGRCLTSKEKNYLLSYRKKF